MVSVSKGKLLANNENNTSNTARQPSQWLFLFIAIIGTGWTILVGYMSAQIAVQVEMARLTLRVAIIEKQREDDRAVQDKAAAVLLNEIRQNRTSTRRIGQSVDRLLMKAGMALPPYEE